MPANPYDRPEFKYLNEDLGYADGYADFLRELGREDVKDATKGIPTRKQINKQVDQFRQINAWGDNKLERPSDQLEDPTFIIFDLQIDTIESPLFNQVQGFINEYSDSMSELAERQNLYNQFVNIITKIFPTDAQNLDSGKKRHYINSVSGLDNLFKKIVNFPEDLISFTLSEDITMLSQYLSELYSNLIYSYDTHRYMIPDNLLRFNITMAFRDVRDMKKPIFDTSGEKLEGFEINENISKFMYVLHDCQFDFFSSRNFGSDVSISGFEGGATTTPSTLSFNINYKSYSKITIPALIDDSIIINLRERDSGNLQDMSEYFQRMNNDYKTEEQRESYFEQTSASEEYTSNIRNNLQNNANRNISVDEVDKNRPLEKIRNAFTDEISDVRNVVVNKLNEQVTRLTSDAQRFISDEVFGDANLFGFQKITLTKVNVYYDTPLQALDRVSNVLENFLDDSIDIIRDKISVDISSDKINIYYDTDAETFSEGATEFGRELIDPTGVGGRTGSVQPRGQYNQKFPDGDVHDDGVYNQKYPDGDRHEDGTYNEKYPSGDIHEDGTYNEKYPDKDVHEDGQYNLKFPDGDVHEDGQYNEKYPDGDRHEDGTYNEKYPSGDVHEDGQYNEKYPDGDVHEDGVYNEKYPDGDVHEDGQYNEKYPSGDIHEDGQYNIKFPDGDVHEDGTYNEKYPDGDVHEDGTYNEKTPNGNSYGDDETIIDKRPEGNVYGKIDNIENKEPDGDVHEDGKYNDKYPDDKNRYKED